MAGFPENSWGSVEDGKPRGLGRETTHVVEGRDVRKAMLKKQEIREIISFCHHLNHLGGSCIR